MDEESVPENERVLETDSVLPLVRVKVPVEEVMVSPLIEVAVAAPRVGVIKVGEVPNTRAPEPVSSVREAEITEEVAEEERSLDASVKTSLLAVKGVMVIVSVGASPRTVLSCTVRLAVIWVVPWVVVPVRTRELP